MKDPFEEASADVDRRGATFILIAAVLGLVVLGIARPGARGALLIVAGIVLMVMLHEAGHYLTAKRAGMKVTEFFLGFGPRLWSFRRGETEYGVKAILLGGYVRIIGMSNLEPPVEPEDESRTFRRGSYVNRLVVILAGVTVNILIAFVLFFVVIAGQGRVAEGLTTTVSHVVGTSAAAEAGMEKGDKIVAVDGTRIDGWDDLKTAIEKRGGAETTFTVVRDGERVELFATPEKRDGQGFLGVGPTLGYRNVGVLEAVPESFRLMGDVVVGTGEAFGRIFSPDGIERYSRNFTSEAPKSGSPAAVERPRSIIGIVDFGSQIVGGDGWVLLLLLGNISLALAIFNLIPLLPFDGGHAAIVAYEWVASKVTRRTVRVDYRKLMPVTAVVIAVFLTFALSVMFLDIRDLAR